MVQDGGFYYVIGYGENINIPTIDVISREISFIGNLVGTYNDLVDLMTLTAQGKVSLHTSTYPLDAINDAMADLDARAAAGPRHPDPGRRLRARRSIVDGQDPLLQPRGTAAAPGGRRRARQHGQGDARAEGPQRRARAAHRRADDHQRRRLDRARDRALEPAEEHGRPARPRGRQQDERPHRRRDDDGDAARPGDRPRGDDARSRRAPTRCCCAAGSRRRPSSSSPSSAAARGRSAARPTSPTSRRSPPRRTSGSARRWRARSTASAPRASSRSRSPSGPGIEVEFVEGMHVDNGHFSPYLIQDAERMETVFENPYVLLTSKPISHVQDLMPTLDAVMKEPRPLVIFAEKVEGRGARADRPEQPARDAARRSSSAPPGSATAGSRTSRTSPRSPAGR